MIPTYNTIKDIYAWLTVDVKNRVLFTFTKFKQNTLLYNKKIRKNNQIRERKKHNRLY